MFIILLSTFSRLCIFSCRYMFAILSERKTHEYFRKLNFRVWRFVCIVVVAIVNIVPLLHTSPLLAARTLW